MLNMLRKARSHVANYVIIKKRFYQKDVQITFLNKVDIRDNLKGKTIIYQRFYKSSKDQ